jgi:hypothetical protein
MNADTNKWARVHSLREWGRVKQKLFKQACKIFAFFCQSQLAGIIGARNPWLFLRQPRRARGLLRIFFCMKCPSVLSVSFDSLRSPFGAPLLLYLASLGCG